MCLGISGVWTHLGQGAIRQTWGKKVQAGLFVLHAIRILCLSMGFQAALFFFWAKNRQKVTHKKRASDRTVEKMGPKFLKFHLMQLLPRSPHRLHPQTLNCLLLSRSGMAFATLAAITGSFSPSFLQHVYLHHQQW